MDVCSLQERQVEWTALEAWAKSGKASSDDFGVGVVQQVGPFWHIWFILVLWAVTQPKRSHQLVDLRGSREVSCVLSLC